MCIRQPCSVSWFVTFKRLKHQQLNTLCNWPYLKSRHHSQHYKQLPDFHAVGYPEHLKSPGKGHDLNEFNHLHQVGEKFGTSEMYSLN